MENKWRRFVMGLFVAASAMALALGDLSRNIRRLRAAPVADADNEHYVAGSLFMLGIAIWFWVIALMSYADYRAEQAVRAPEAVRRDSPTWREGLFCVAALVLFIALFWLSA
jgi:hypothetical protein